MPHHVGRKRIVTGNNGRDKVGKRLRWEEALKYTPYLAIPASTPPSLTQKRQKRPHTYSFYSILQHTHLPTHPHIGCSFLPHVWHLSSLPSSIPVHRSPLAASSSPASQSQLVKQSIRHTLSRLSSHYPGSQSAPRAAHLTSFSQQNNKHSR